MSFSSDVKEELSKLNNYRNKKELEAEFLGYMLSSNANFSKNNVIYITENEFNIERFYKILFNLEIEYEPEIVGKIFSAKMVLSEKLYSYLKLRLDLSDEEKRSVVKGVFLGAGSVNNPEKQNHLEIGFNKKENMDFINNICKSFDIYLKELVDKENHKYTLYIKDGETISMFLALIGANQSVLKFEEIRVVREIKNNVNRKVNCETANLNKTVSASVIQVDDIRLLIKLKKFDDLPDYLKEIAYVRMDNPDASLKELGELLDNKISKSGVNHRLQKIHEIAEEYRVSGKK